MATLSELLQPTYSTAKMAIQHFAELKCFVQDNLYLEQYTTFSVLYFPEDRSVRQR